MQNSNLVKSLKYLLFFLALSLFFYFLDTNGYLSFLHQGSDFLAVPVEREIYQSKVKLIKTDTQKKQEELRKVKNELFVAQEKNNQLEEENRSLRKQLETPLPPQWEYQDAKVIGLGEDLIIDKGKKNKLTAGQIVLSQNILVGKIKTVSPGQSQVQLLTNPRAKIPVKTGQTKAKGILTGEFGTRIILEKVLQADKLKVGDTVITTGEADYPQGLLIGKIKKVFRNEKEIYQKAEIEPFLNYSELVTIFVLVKD